MINFCLCFSVSLSFSLSISVFFPPILSLSLSVCSLCLLSLCLLSLLSLCLLSLSLSLSLTLIFDLCYSTWSRAASMTRFWMTWEISRCVTVLWLTWGFLTRTSTPYTPWWPQCFTWGTSHSRKTQTTQKVYIRVKLIMCTAMNYDVFHLLFRCQAIQSCILLQCQAILAL